MAKKIQKSDRHIFEACIWVVGGGGYQYPISLEVDRKVSHISLSKLENIPLIKFPKYPISLEVNKISMESPT